MRSAALCGVSRVTVTTAQTAGVAHTLASGAVGLNTDSQGVQIALERNVQRRRLVEEPDQGASRRPLCDKRFPAAGCPVHGAGPSPCPPTPVFIRRRSIGGPMSIATPVRMVMVLQWLGEGRRCAVTQWLLLVHAILARRACPGVATARRPRGEYGYLVAAVMKQQVARPYRVLRREVRCRGVVDLDIAGRLTLASRDALGARLIGRSGGRPRPSGQPRSRRRQRLPPTMVRCGSV